MKELINLDSELLRNSSILESGHSFEGQRLEILNLCKLFLDLNLDIVKSHHRQGAVGSSVVEAITQTVDQLVDFMFQAVSTDLDPDGFGACTLVAIGGYGRGELNPISDLDLMFLHEGRHPEFAQSVAERMLYLLWDLKLDVGYSVRTFKDCLEMSDRDITARTALLDSRYLAGDEALFESYQKTVMSQVLAKDTQGFIQAKIEEREKRFSKYGSSVYILEPNIKEGEGGLRDLHSALWIARVRFKASSLRDLLRKGLLTEKETRDFEQAFEYLWRVRNELHFLSQRKNDQLHFEHQVNIAAYLGYQDSKTGLAVEHFMQDYYAHATFVEHISSSLIAKASLKEEGTFRFLGIINRRNLEEGFYILRGELGIQNPALLAEDPTRIMLAFELAQRHEVDLSIALKGHLRETLPLMRSKERNSRRTASSFLNILRSSKGVVKTLRDMHHLQVLNYIIPEFGRIFCKVQHDAYHIYTVDVHSIFAVEEITRLWDGSRAETHPTLTRVAADVEKRELLLLACLLHDIGKGHGSDHCKRGAEMIPRIARRLGLKKEDTNRLQFLVVNHLRMSRTAQRRDLNDEKLIIEFARSMEMSENLNMLYLLTYADLRAVGPDVWSDWKGFLLEELYLKSFQVLEKGHFRLERRTEKVRNRMRKVVDLLEDDIAPRTVKELLRNMSTPHLLSHPLTELAEQIRLIESRGSSAVAVQVDHDEEHGFSRVMIATLNTEGLFSWITGAMSANGINILGALIRTLRNGVVLDVLQVTGGTGEIITDEHRWSSLRDDLVSVIEGRVRVDELVEKRRSSMNLMEKAIPRFPNRVQIHNEISDQYSVIDVYAHDCVGLLYAISRTLTELGLTIGVSKISTTVDQVTDTFYVQDIFGSKIRDEAKLEQITQSLLAALDEL